MFKLELLTAALVAVLLLSGSIPVNAGVITWSDWTSASVPETGATPAGIPGSASGTLGSVSVSYSGNVLFVQTTPGGENYWTSNTPDPFSGVLNGPSPNSDIVALTGGDTTVNTISFSAPVLNPILAVNSIGRISSSATYFFDQPFTILSYGDGYSRWSGAGSLTQSGNDLIGLEGTGVIQFSGSVSSISWTVPTFEYWHGFTVVAESSAVLVPEPSSIFLWLTGVAGAGCFQWTRRHRWTL